MKYITFRWGHSLLALFLFFLSNVGISQKKCNCLICPYKPDSCFAICSKKILASSKASELSLILGLSDTLAKKVFTIGKQQKMNNLEDYLVRLNPAERDTLTNSLKSVNSFQQFYFNQPAKDRTLMTTNIQRLMQQKEEFDKTHT